MHCYINNYKLSSLATLDLTPFPFLIRYRFEMRFNLKTGAASQKQLSVSSVEFPRINENYNGRYNFTRVSTAEKFWITDFFFSFLRQLESVSFFEFA